HVRGAGYGFSLQDTFRPFRRKLLFTALWDRYSRNFLVVREESVYSAVSRKSLSSAFQPFRYINFTGSVHSNTALVGVSDLEHGYSYGADFTIPHTSLQFGYYRANTEQGGPYPVRFNLTQYSFQMPQAGRFSASAIYSQVEFNSEMVRSYTETLGANLKKLGRVTLHDQYQPESSHVYGFDWSRQFEKGLYILGGLERETSEVEKPILAPVASLRVPLPHKQKLTMSYMAFGGTKLFQFEIGGQLLGHRELVNLNNQTALLVPASLTGRVYFDANLDGRYESSVD